MKFEDLQEISELKDTGPEFYDRILCELENLSEIDKWGAEFLVVIIDIVPKTIRDNYDFYKTFTEKMNTVIGSEYTYSTRLRLEILNNVLEEIGREAKNSG